MMINESKWRILMVKNINGDGEVNKHSTTSSD